MPQYFVKNPGGDEVGPLSGRDVIRLVEDGFVDADTLIRDASRKSWHRATSVAAVAAALDRQSQASAEADPELTPLDHEHVQLINSNLDSILAMRESADMLMVAVRGGAEAAAGDIAKPICGGLRLVLLFNHDVMTRGVIEADAARLGLGIDECFERAIGNTLDHVRRDGYSLSESDDGVMELELEDAYMTSGLLASAQFIGFLSRQLGGDVIASVPRRHIVLVARRSPATISAMRKRAQAAYEEDEGSPVSSLVLAATLTGDQCTWSVLAEG
jgi:hypothetical protein